MNFLWWRKQTFLNPQQTKALTNAIAIAEKNTSGEIRVFIERKCKNRMPLERAKEIFAQHKMQHTEQRNAVLLYLSYQDKSVAVYGDVGIHEKVRNTYWDNIIANLINDLSNQRYEQGIVSAILNIGEQLKTFFPYHEQDENELSNDIIFQ